MSIYIIGGKREQRTNHWNEIKTRVTTHEGEVLSGREGKKYQQKWSKKYLGRDLGEARPVSSQDVERFEKTGK